MPSREYRFLITRECYNITWELKNQCIAPIKTDFEAFGEGLLHAIGSFYVRTERSTYQEPIITR